VETYPSDDWGLEIDELASFEGLLEHMYNGGDFYRYISENVGCSIMRERIFSELSHRCEVDYDVIYDLWLDKEIEPTIEELQERLNNYSDLNC